ncbi:ArsR family transcriptional regulator [Streptomyces bikiniensis]|uniref:ArsR family transcriptional regulator n=1 Tax=Streptomyces bikiniensis TaxID=1896 RepID=UPI00131A5974|nr:ArsR family transcriptional regulator [Streptomyces bikiniensis]
MIEIPLRGPGAGCGPVRIAGSRLWETLASIGQLSSHRGLAPWPYTHWERAARRSLTRADVTVPGWLVHLYQVRGGALPSFLLPVPSPAPDDRSPGDPVQDLAALRAVPPDRVREELDQWSPRGLPPGLRPLYADPRERLAELCDFLPRYWRAALGPYAASLRSATEEDVLRRARVLATQGPEQLLAGLRGRVSRRGDVLRPHVGPSGRVAVPDASRLVLVPLLFGRGAPFFAVDPHGTVAVAYQAEGAAVLVGDVRPPGRPGGAPARGDGLEILLGRSRAGVVRGLVVPTTTSDLAAELGLAPSTVSEHLTALVAAGVARRRRAGVRVLYELDGPGVALLRHLDHRRRVNEPETETS